MLRQLLLAASILISPAGAAIVSVMASGDTAPISLDEIEESKSARLMKNKEDIDVQSNYHEDDIKDTGDVPDEYAARLVKNRGPITAKIMASGSHGRYCGKGDKDDDCNVNISLVAWKFAGDRGTVHGHLVEEFNDAEVMKVDVDCMVRNKDNTEAIIGGVVTTAPDRHPAGKAKSHRAYVKVIDNGTSDFVSNVYFDDELNSHCTTAGLGDNFDLGTDKNVVNPRVSVCSKHGDWDKCLAKAKIEQAIQ